MYLWPWNSPQMFSKYAADLYGRLFQTKLKLVQTKNTLGVSVLRDLLIKGWFSNLTVRKYLLETFRFLSLPQIASMPHWKRTSRSKAWGPVFWLPVGFSRQSSHCPWTTAQPLPPHLRAVQHCLSNGSSRAACVLRNIRVGSWVLREYFLNFVFNFNDNLEEKVTWNMFWTFCRTTL